MPTAGAVAAEAIGIDRNAAHQSFSATIQR